MLFKDLKQKKFVYMGIITLDVLFFIILSIFLIIKYSVEGETKMPFELSKISVISTAESDIKTRAYSLPIILYKMKIKHGKAILFKKTIYFYI